MLSKLYIQPDPLSENKFKQKERYMLTLFSINPKITQYNPRGID